MPGVVRSLILFGLLLGLFAAVEHSLPEPHGIALTLMEVSFEAIAALVLFARVVRVSSTRDRAVFAVGLGMSCHLLSGDASYGYLYYWQKARADTVIAIALAKLPYAVVF